MKILKDIVERHTKPEVEKPVNEAKVTKINGVPLTNPKQKLKKLGIGGMHDWSKFYGIEIHSYNPKKEPPMIVSGTAEAIVKFMTTTLRAESDDVYVDVGSKPGEARGIDVDPDWAKDLD